MTAEFSTKEEGIEGGRTEGRATPLDVTEPEGDEKLLFPDEEGW